jgi:type IV secretion system protein VirB6
MAGVCPAPGPDDPLVRSLLGVVDCNVQNLVQTGYGAIFASSGVFASVLTVLLTLYVALIGYQLLLGRSQLNITDFAMTAVKLGAVVALATQWGTYQTVVYQALFFGPQQIANVLLHAFRANGAGFTGDVFDGLQRAFTDLTAFSPATPPGAAAAAAAPPSANGQMAAGAGQLSTLLNKGGFDSLLLLASAVILLISSLGVLLAAKIILGILLALGPIFIAMLLFDTTRGIFEGWLRTSVAFAFAPIIVTLMLGVALTLLEPWLEQVETMRDSNTYIPGVAFGVLILVMVFAGVAMGMVGAAAGIAGGFKLPRARTRAAQGAGAVTTTNAAREAAIQPRAERVAASIAAQSQRDATLYASAAAAAASGAAGDRRTTVSTTMTQSSAVAQTAVESRLGQGPRRNASPRLVRSGARSSQGASQ